MKYCCYGSNLNHSQMKVRCPKSKFLGTGILEGFRLNFKAISTESYATINKHNSYVPVGIWEIANEDWKQLDAYEGYPNLYRKEIVEVKLPDGNKEDMITYIMNDTMGNGIEIPPSIYYLNTCIQGYADCGLLSQIWVLNKAVNDSVVNLNKLIAEIEKDE